MQESLIPMLLAGVLGLLAGIGLTGLLSARRRRAAAPGKAGTHRHAAQNAARPARATLAPSALQPDGKPLLPQAADLLLVDDSAVARTKLRRLFERAGYQVHLASDGVEALNLLRDGRYAMMITDLEMPNMDGVTLINTCFDQPHTAGMPIVAISGHESLRAKFDECRRISGIHRKPWADDVLLSHVAALVGTRTLPAKDEATAA